MDKDNEELVVNRHAIKELTELESTSRALIHENQANEAIALGLSYATNLVMHVTEELKEILNILQISKNGHLALGAITYAGAKKILSNLGEKAEQKGYDLISKEPHQVFDLPASCMTTVNGFYIFLHIPLKSKDDTGVFRLFKYHPLNIKISKNIFATLVLTIDCVKNSRISQTDIMTS